MEQSRWFRAGVVLVSLGAVVYLILAMIRLWDFMGDLIMIVFSSWLVAAILIHLIDKLMTIPHMKRPVAIVIVYMGFATLLAVFALLVMPATASQVQDLARDIPEYVTEIPEALEGGEEFLANLGLNVDLVSRYELISVETMADQATSFLTDEATGILQGLVTTILAIGLVLVLSFYIVLDGGRRLNQSLTVLPENWEKEVRLVLRTFDNTFHGYLSGLLVVSLIYGISTASVMFSMDLPLALPVAILASLFLAVPFIGDWLALALPLLIAALAGDFFTFVVVLAVLLFVQQVMLNLLTPRILGRAVRMPAMLVVISVVLGARLAGVPGAFFGVPVAAVIYSLAVTYGTRIRERRIERAQTKKRSVKRPVKKSPTRARRRTLDVGDGASGISASTE